MRRCSDFPSSTHRSTATNSSTSATTTSASPPTRPTGWSFRFIKNADAKGLLEIAAETSELAGKARDGKLALGDMQGGTFTISSIGGIGGTAFTQIVNAPEVAILGAVRASMKPVWNGNEFVPRLMLPISVSYDHRVVDGAGAARFLAYIAALLGDFKRVSL